MQKLIILAAIVAFVAATVIFGGAVASDATARARNAAANELQAKAALEIAKGQSEAIVTRANADAYSDRALANVPIWILAFVLGIVCLVAAIVVIVRIADRPQAQGRQEQADPASVIVLINGQPISILPKPGQTRREQIDAALEFAYYAGGFVEQPKQSVDVAVFRY